MLRLPLLARLQRRSVRAALPPPLRARLRELKREQLGWAHGRALRRTPLALARFVVVDLETTGPRRDRDRVIAIGAVAVRAGLAEHGDGFAAVLRQPRASEVANILVHRIGGQQQLAGQEPATALVDFLEYRGAAVAVAFRAAFDAPVLARELALTLGIRVPRRWLDLAVLLPALFPGTQNDTLEEWLEHFGIEPVGRHDAVADAYAAAQLFLVVLAAARRLGARTTGELLAWDAAQRWLGLRR